MVVPMSDPPRPRGRFVSSLAGAVERTDSPKRISPVLLQMLMKLWGLINGSPARFPARQFEGIGTLHQL